MDKNKSQVPTATHQHNKMTNERTLLEGLLKDHCLEESLKHNVKAGITQTSRQLLESVMNVLIGEEREAAEDKEGSGNLDNHVRQAARSEKRAEWERRLGKG